MLLSGLGYGCTREPGFVKEDRDGLTFKVTTAQWQGGVFAQTKAPKTEDISWYLTDITDETGEVAYMMEAMEGAPVQPSKTLGSIENASTKATEKTAWVDADQFGLRAYATGNDYSNEFDYFGASKCAIYDASDDTWSMSENLYWPTSRNLVKFYAWWPYDAGNAQPGFDGTDKLLTYTVSTDPTQQQDLLYATTNQLNVIGSQGVVPLEFKHALTAVVFKGAEGELNLAIKRIELQNVWTVGEFNMDSEGWMVDKSDPSNMKNISFDAYHSYRGDSAAPEGTGWYYSDDNGANWHIEGDPIEREKPVLNDNGNLLMLIPQDIVDADGTTRRRVVFTLMDDTTVECDLPQTPAWTPGTTVIYTLQKGGRLTFLNSQTFYSKGNGPDPFTTKHTFVQAWKYRNNSDGSYSKVRCNFKVSKIRRYRVNTGTIESGSDITPDGNPIDPALTYGMIGFLPEGVTYDQAIANGLNTWTGSDGCTPYSSTYWYGTVGYPSPVAMDHYSTKEIMDAALRAKTSVGSDTDYYDLSATATANCYIVEAPGYYKFKAVKGNDAANTEGLNLTGATISYIADNDNIIDGDCSIDGNYIKFKTQTGLLEHGNVIITAKDASDNVLWQWHVWVTDSANWHPTGESTIHSSVGGATTNYTFHPVSLGLSYRGYYEVYNDYSIVLTITLTDESFVPLTGRWAKTSSIVIHRIPNPVEEGYYYAAYKWGDAVPSSFFGYGGSTLTGKSNPEFPVPTVTNLTPVQHTLTATTWNSSATTDGPYAATYGVSKTIYDPSPAGWHIPPPQATNNLGTADHTFANVHGYDDMSPGFSTDYLYMFNKHQDGSAVTDGIAFWFRSGWYYWTGGTGDSGPVTNAYSSYRTSAETWGPAEVSATTGGLIRPVKD